MVSTSNRAAAQAMAEACAPAAIDVTGFGFLGHLLQRLDETVTAEVRFGAIPVLEEAFDLAAAGIWPGGSKRNMEAMADRVDDAALDEVERKVLYDAQTSGGLLIATAPERAGRLMERLREAGVDAAPVGRLVAGEGRMRVVR